jgi:transcriptional regulator with XRE-family HTH domain
MKKSQGLGKVIRSLRKMAGMTQAQLAHKAGLERTSVTNIELGMQPLNEKTINALAGAMGYEVHVTFRRRSPMAE